MPTLNRMLTKKDLIMVLTVAIVGLLMTAWGLARLQSRCLAGRLEGQLGIVAQLAAREPESDLTIQHCGATGDPTQVDAPGTYIVKAGDTLSRIAEAHYGNGFHYRALYKLHNEKAAQPDGREPSDIRPIRDPNVITPDEKIFLPTSRAIRGEEAGREPATPLAPTTWRAEDANRTIRLSGSSTVFPVATQAAECFRLRGYPGTIRLKSRGSFAGMQDLCKDAADVAMVSVASGDVDLRKAGCDGIGDLVDLPIASDAVTIVVGAGTVLGATNISLSGDELAGALVNATTWRDVRKEWPMEPIHRFYPGPNSGTRKFMCKILSQLARVQPGDCLAIVSPSAAIANGCSVFGTPVGGGRSIVESEDDDLLARLVAADQYAIGFMGYSYFSRHRDHLKSLAVLGVEPDHTSVDSNRYQLARPLTLWVRKSTLRSRADVLDFLRFTLREARWIALDAHAFPALDAELTHSQHRLEEASR